MPLFLLFYFWFVFFGEERAFNFDLGGGGVGIWCSSVGEHWLICFGVGGIGASGHYGCAAL